MKSIYRYIALGVLLIGSAFIITASFYFFAISHKSYPDKWLVAEESIVRFFERVTLPIKLSRLSLLPADEKILMPIHGIRVFQVEDTWDAPRPGGRTHEGQDIFVPKGTPVFSGTGGYVTRIGEGDLGGNYVFITGAGGMRYYYAHLDRFAEGLRVGQKVTTDTVIGYVGNTGNAAGTPYHLHFGAYKLRKAVNPWPLLANR